MKFEQWIEITDDEARCLVNHIYACPDTSEKFKTDKYHILHLLWKGILTNGSGQHDHYQLRLSKWGEQYFWKVKSYVENHRPELLDKKR